MEKIERALRADNIDFEGRKISVIRRILLVISCIAALSLFAAFMSVNEGHPDLGFGLMAVFVFLGVYVFIATLERPS